MAMCASHTNTKNTTMHHPLMHSDTDTDSKHNKSRQFRTHQDQSRTCFFRLVRGCPQLNLCWSTREWVVAALGRRWTWRLWRATCRRASRRVSSPWTVGGQAAVFGTVLPQASGSSSTSCQPCCEAFDARALGRDPRAHRGITWANFRENRVKSLHIVSNQFTKGSPLSGLASVGRRILEEDRNESTAVFGRDLLQRFKNLHS